MKIKQLLVILMYSISITSLNAQNRSISYNYEQILEIKNDKDNIHFVLPKYIVTDVEGDIFISDQRLSGIKKFNSKGEYLGQIGRRGRGPGEFLDISTISINCNDELYVIDRFSMRLTKLKTDGEIIEAIKFPNKKMISPWQGKVSKDGRIYLLYRNYSVDPAEVLNENIIHIYNNSFTNMIESIVDINLIGNLNNDFEDAIIGGPTTSYFDINDDEIIIAPYLNKGKVYKFIYTNNSWIKNELDAFAFNEKYYELNDPDNPPALARVIGMGNKTLVGTITQSNAGTFYINDSLFVVFSYNRNEDNNYEFGVSLFDNQRNKLIGYTNIEELPIPKDKAFQTSPITPAWYDGEKFYFIDIREDDPKIIVATIDFDI